MKQLLFFLIVLSTSLSAVAQQNGKPPIAPKSPLAIEANVYGDSIVLRWGVSEAAYWLQANERGYYLERLEYTTPNAKPFRRMMSALPIKPWSLDMMKQRLARNDPYAAAAAQMLYGKGFTKDLSANSLGFYELYEEQQGRLFVAMMIADFSSTAANALALRWVDKRIDKNAFRYEYRLWLNNSPKPSATDLTDTVSVVVNPRVIKAIEPPIVSEIESGDGLLDVKWFKNAPTTRFSGFYVERSTDGQTFQRLNKTPYVASQSDSLIITYRDSVRINYQKFYYRVVGITAFGDVSPSSKVLSGFAKDLTPPKPPVKIDKKVENNSRIVLSWEMSAPLPTDLRGFRVSRASYIDGAYEILTPTLLPATARSFADLQPSAYKGRYYKIAAVDTAGNVAEALPIAATIQDLTPPVPPKGLAIKVDTNGIATLQWPEHPEEDVIGFKIYRSYQRDDPYYRPITSTLLADTILTDTLPIKSLTRMAYYKIVAVDLSNNHSDFSAPVAVEMPDKTPPAPPVLKSIVSNPRHVILNIIPSASADVVEYWVYRQEENTIPQVIKKLTGFRGEAFAIKDSSVVHQKSYQYSVVARDQRGLTSKVSNGVLVSFFDASLQQVAPPTHLSAAYDSTQKQIKVEWKSPKLTENAHFVIYRGINGQPVSMYKAVSGQSFFIDNNLPQEGTYTYGIRLITSEKQSVLSQTISLNYKK